MQDCFPCRKHAGLEAQPPGGYIVSDEHWRVCHAMPEHGPVGTLFVESSRHLLDFAELTPAEAAAYGALLVRVFAALRQATGAARIYTLMTLEGIAHCHVWLVPRLSDEPARGLKYLAQDLRCAPAEAEAMAARLRALLGV